MTTYEIIAAVFYGLIALGFGFGFIFDELGRKPWWEVILAWALAALFFPAFIGGWLSKVMSQ